MRAGGGAQCVKIRGESAWKKKQKAPIYSFRLGFLVICWASVFNSFSK